MSAYPSISHNDILDLQIELPINMTNFGPINNQFDAIYSQISKRNKENKKLMEFRDWLLPMLMNGQVTVD